MFSRLLMVLAMFLEAGMVHGEESIAPTVWRAAFGDAPMPMNSFELDSDVIFQHMGEANGPYQGVCERPVSDVWLKKVYKSKPQTTIREYMQVGYAIDGQCTLSSMVWFTVNKNLPIEAFHQLMPFLVNSLDQESQSLLPKREDWNSLVRAKIAELPFAFIDVGRPATENSPMFVLNFCKGFGISCWSDKLMLGLRPSSDGYTIEPSYIVID